VGRAPSHEGCRARVREAGSSGCGPEFPDSKSHSQNHFPPSNTMANLPSCTETLQFAEHFVAFWSMSASNSRKEGPKDGATLDHASRLANRVQMTTDGHHTHRASHVGSVPCIFAAWTPSRKLPSCCIGRQPSIPEKIDSGLTAGFGAKNKKGSR